MPNKARKKSMLKKAPCQRKQHARKKESNMQHARKKATCKKQHAEESAILKKATNSGKNKPIIINATKKPAC